ncbi:MAG: alpha-L-rhamnosidase, partial [Firmicutes bacterium]|nr:alpha-L-rhamnosidase [Bacillota bacterium]
QAYTYMRATADYASRHIPAEGPLAGLVTRLSGGAGKYQYGNIDWPPAGRFGYDTKTYARTTVNALAVGVFDTVALAARALGEDGAEEYETRAANLRAAMNEKLITPGGLYCDGLRKRGAQSRHAGQHANSYALAFGIAPEGLRDSLADYITGMEMRQGPMTANVLLEALFQTGRARAALRLLTNTDDLGWARLIEKYDATFTWEQWTVGRHQSQSHGWGAAGLAQLLEYAAGVRVTEPGAAAIEINPLAAGLLDRMSARVVTERGPVEVSYTSGEGQCTLKIDVPANVRAVVVLPGRMFEVGSGAREYIFTLD